MKAHDILNNPFLNKGTAFTQEERKELGLIGLLPPHVQTIEEQAEQAYLQYVTKESDIEKPASVATIKRMSRSPAAFFNVSSMFSG